MSGLHSCNSRRSVRNFNFQRHKSNRDPADCSAKAFASTINEVVTSDHRDGSNTGQVAILEQTIHLHRPRRGRHAGNSIHARQECFSESPVPVQDPVPVPIPCSSHEAIISAQLSLTPPLSISATCPLVHLPSWPLAGRWRS